MYHRESYRIKAVPPGFLAILEKKRRYTHTLVIWYVDGLPVTNLSLYYYTFLFQYCKEYEGMTGPKIKDQRVKDQRE
jgi:hypothetical protein